ncbi:S-layer homology domain-containing protein [Caloranaerobacter sp. DY30410]|uniref:S-layer homology domain-containing protein n=1 Tax=Caloranaerobacter sp. DY30410 TaxID=3238305 RepID=UPI003CFE9CB6
MFKKCCLVLIIINLLFSSAAFSAADFSEKLNGHWAEKLVDEDFMKIHFAYLTKEDYSNFIPDKPISKGDFLVSLYSLIKTSDLLQTGSEQEDILNVINYFKIKGILTDENVSSEEQLLRKEAVKWIVECLKQNGGVEIVEKHENPFIDLDGLTDEYITPILEAYDLGLIKGYSDSSFRPNDTVSQVEAIILLQRLEEELKMNNKSISFKVIENSRTYSEIKKDIQIEEQDDKVIVTISKQFPNSGYSIEVNKIQKMPDGNYNIYIGIKQPDPKKMYLQVITYCSITIEIDKNDLGNPPYQFNVVWQGL